MKVILYGNGGCGNHGCEAIVRGTSELLREPLIVLSENPEEDCRYGISKYGEIINARSKKISLIHFIKAYIQLKLRANYTEMDGLPYVTQIRKIRERGNLALSTGGDNYCYTNQAFYTFLNKEYQKNGMKTVLWGCSITPEIIKKKDIEQDLKAYNLIVARESITYQALKEIGANAILNPDPAFYMKPEECVIDKRFKSNNVVGINISPMILAYEKRDESVYENYRNLIEYILQYTDMYIALIPHVVWEKNDDRRVLARLYREFNQDERMIVVDDHIAPELKYIISKCRIFVGARTHATIAAYSMAVPTLVVGYSVKAQGIARDLFGTTENYVLPVQELSHKENLMHAFQWIKKHEVEIRSHLIAYIPKYIAKGENIKAILEKL